MRGVDGEDGLLLERGNIRVDLGPVNGKRASVVLVIACNREAGRAAHVLLFRDVEANRALLDPVDRNASHRNIGDVGAVGGLNRVLEVFLPREVRLGDREGEGAILVREEVLDHRLIVSVRLEGDGEATNLDVIGRLDRDLGVLRRVEGLRGLIHQSWLFGVLVELHELRGNLRGSRLSRRRFRDLSDLAHLEVLGIDRVVNALICLGVIVAVFVVEDAAYGVARAGLNLHAAKRAVGHAAHVGLDKGEAVRINTVVLGEVFDGLVVVVAVLDPHDHRAAGLDDLIGGFHGPHGLVAHLAARTGVLIGDLVVSEADRFGGRIVNFNEFVAVALAGVGGIGNELGNEELADGRIGRRAGDVFGGGGLSRLLGLRLCTAVLELLRVNLASGGSSRALENFEALGVRVGRGTELCGLALSDRAFRVERARDFGAVRVENANAAVAAVRHTRLAGDALDARVRIHAPLCAELFDGVRGRIDLAVIARVAQPQGHGLSGGQFDRLLGCEGNVLCGVSAVLVDVGERVAALTDREGFVGRVRDLDEFVVVVARVVRGDLGDDERPGARWSCLGGVHR